MRGSSSFGSARRLSKVSSSLRGRREEPLKDVSPCSPGEVALIAQPIRPELREITEGKLRRHPVRAPADDSPGTHGKVLRPSAHGPSLSAEAVRPSCWQRLSVAQLTSARSTHPLPMISNPTVVASGHQPDG